MIAYEPLEIIVTPEITYIRFDQLGEIRRIYTDGRSWPEKITPSFEGYSIGKWVDPDAEGRYGALEVETRGLRGSRTLDASGLPLHPDNQTIVKERIYLDAANRNRLHDQITIIDHAYTRPWTVTRDYNRKPDPVWVETNCVAENHYVLLGKETYFIDRGRLSDADPEEPAGTRPEEFRAAAGAAISQPTIFEEEETMIRSYALAAAAASARAHRHAMPGRPIRCRPRPTRF